MGVPLCVSCCFSFAAFDILCLSLPFAILSTVCPGGVLMGLTLFRTLSASWVRVSVCFPRLGEFCHVFYCAVSPCSLFPFWDPYNAALTMLEVIPEISWTVLISFYSFFCSVSVIFFFYYSVFHFADLFLHINSLIQCSSPHFSYCIFFFFILRLHLWNMDVPRLGIKLEVKLLAYATATSGSKIL